MIIRPKISLYLLALSLLIISCNQGEQNNQNFSDKVPAPFNEIMKEMVEKYPDLPKIQNPNKSYGQVYALEQKSYIRWRDASSRKNIDLELRQHNACGGCWPFQVIHVYNDSVHHIIPLTDFYRYWKFPSDEPHNSDVELSFVNELNVAVNKFDIGSNKYHFIDEIMKSMLGYFNVQKYDLPKLELISKEISVEKDRFRSPGENNYLYSEECRANLDSTLQLVKEKVNQGNRLIYSDGILIFMFSYDEEGKILLEVLNKKCFYRLII